MDEIERHLKILVPFPSSPTESPAPKKIKKKKEEEECAAMDDLPLEKLQIPGPTLASLIQRVSTSPGDVDGLLFGRVTFIPPSKLSDDNSSPDSPTLVGTITSFFCSSSTCTFYDASGKLNLLSLRALLPPSYTLLGWFSFRRRTPLRPSLRETSLTSSLSSTTQLSFQPRNSTKSYNLSPSIFLLLTTPRQDQLIHTHDHRAYQYRFSTRSFQPQTLEVINIGPAFRQHYNSFLPHSPFPEMTCKLESTSMAEDENLNTMRRAAKDQKQLDACADGFQIGRLAHLMGSHTPSYTTELEGLYTNMLDKLRGLTKLVDKSSAKVAQQENYNMKLRYKVAGLE